MTDLESCNLTYTPQTFPELHFISSIEKPIAVLYLILKRRRGLMLIARNKNRPYKNQNRCERSNLRYLHGILIFNHIHHSFLSTLAKKDTNLELV